MSKKYFLILALAIINFSQAQNCSEPGDTTGDTGCIEFNYKGNSVTYATVRGNDGNIWLQQNLGSDNVATAVNDEASYGDLFQWGRWADGHQNRNSAITATTTPNNPIGLESGNANYLTSWWSATALTDQWQANSPADATDVNGCDPCKALGEGWRLPTSTEWVAVVTGRITSPATALSSFLKLPGTGYRSSTDGGFTFVGARGYYWSSDTANSGGKYLYIGTASANSTSGAPRGQGAAIRCLKVSNLSTGDFSKNKFKIYPNPTSDIITVQTDSDIENITIYNQLGQLIKSQKESKIDLTDVALGMYIVEINFENGQSAVQKIIKK